MSEPYNKSRWSDDKLQQFYEEFQSHIRTETAEHRQQQELYDAVFRKADADTNTPPGLMQLTMQISVQLRDMRIWQDRQKTFVGGVMFALSAAWFFVTDLGHKLIGLIK